jgi:hypothetical protein
MHDAHGLFAPSNRQPSWIAIFPPWLCQQVHYFELHHWEPQIWHSIISMCKLNYWVTTFWNGFKLLNPWVLWLWFWSTDEEKLTAATIFEILTVVSSKIAVLLDVILHAVVDRYSYTSVLHCEDGGSMFLQKTGTFVPNCKVSNYWTNVLCYCVIELYLRKLDRNSRKKAYGRLLCEKLLGTVMYY